MKRQGDGRNVIVTAKVESCDNGDSRTARMRALTSIDSRSLGRFFETIAGLKPGAGLMRTQVRCGACAFG